MEFVKRKDAEIVGNFVEKMKLKNMNLLVNSIIDLSSTSALGSAEKMATSISRTCVNFGLLLENQAQTIRMLGEQLQNAKNGKDFFTLAEVIKQAEAEEEDINTYGN